MIKIEFMPYSQKTGLNGAFNSEDVMSVEFANDKNVKEYKRNFSKFEGKNGEFDIIGNKIVVGTIGIKEKDEWRELGFKVLNSIKNYVPKSVLVPLPSNSEEFIEGMLLANYEFSKYKSEKKDDKNTTVYLYGNPELKQNLEKAKIIVSSQNMVRDLVNTSPEDANSETIQRFIENELNDNVSITVYGEKELKELKMNGHLAVNRASRHDAKTIKLTYEPKESNNGKPLKHICLIGKGLTYDSGGLSLKPATSMTTMKMDKAGAITVFGIMKAISELNLKNVKVTAYMCLAENMIDGSAYKPDDVLTMKNGKTVHIKNTDAEGRIVLFDNICLAQEENKDLTEIYTFATLTGAAVVQFGKEACGMVGFNDKLKSKIKKHGEETGEIFLNAEFHKYMLDGVNDSVADLSNTGTPNMGCQKAGLFLSKAVEEKNINKYLHLDIAGPAYTDKPWGTNKEGATGFAVRTFIHYLESI